MLPATIDDAGGAETTPAADAGQLEPTEEADSSAIADIAADEGEAEPVRVPRDRDRRERDVRHRDGVTLPGFGEGP